MLYRVSTHPGNPGNVVEFVLEFTIFRVLSWEYPGIFLLQFTIFLVIISIKVSSTLKKFGKFFTILEPWIFCALGPYLQYVNIWVFATSKGEKLLLVYHKMCLMSWFFYLIHSILYVDFPQVMFSSTDYNLFM